MSTAGRVAAGGWGYAPRFWAARAWRFLCSLRLAMLLILGFAALLLAGTLVDQAPPGVRPGSPAYRDWLAYTQDKYGPWSDPMEQLGLFGIFQAPYFRGVVALLAINVVACSANRMQAVWADAFGSRVRMTGRFFDSAQLSTTLESPLAVHEAARRMKRSLSLSRYHLKVEGDGPSVALLADKNRLSAFGTFLTHLSIVLILAGVAVGAVFGFEDPRFVIAEGETRALGGTGLAVRLEQFADEYYLDGRPKDFRSEVTLFEEGGEAKVATIRVNDPLRRDGVSFHQSFHGQTAILKVEDPSGRVLHEGGVPLAARSPDGTRPAGRLSLPSQGITAFVTGPRPGGNDPLIRAGEMHLEVHGLGGAGRPTTLTQGEPVAVDGLVYTFEREGRFTGLRVVKDPGIRIIWLACALLVLGMVVLFYFPRRRAWALLTERPGGSEIRLAMLAPRSLSPGRDFRKVSTRVAQAVQAAQLTSQLDEGEGGGRA